MCSKQGEGSESVVFGIFSVGSEPCRVLLDVFEDCSAGFGAGCGGSHLASSILLPALCAAEKRGKVIHTEWSCRIPIKQLAEAVLEMCLWKHSQRKGLSNTILAGLRQGPTAPRAHVQGLLAPVGSRISVQAE